MPNEMAFRPRVPLRFERGEPRLRASCGAESARARFRLARCARGKKGEDRIANDIENVPALLHHGAGGAIEIDIEQIEEGFNGKRVGKAGRIAQVAVPKRCCEPLASAALDQSRQDAPANKRTMEGVERVAGDLVLDDHPERQRERRKHLAHGGDVRLAEPCRAARRP